MRKIVVIPTYNEAENIQRMLETVIKLENDYHVLVVDDSSPDGTGQIVENLSNKYDSIFLLSRTEKSGLGTAYLAGFEWALANNYDYIFEMDADFSHNPEHLDRLYKKAQQGYSVVVGSRYVKIGRIINWPLDRRILSFGGAIYAQMITGIPIKDPTAGFMCYHRSALESIRFDRINSIGYSFQIEMKYACWKLGHKLGEVPITFKDRELGESKMNGSIIKEAATAVWKMRKRNTDYYRNV